MEIDKYKGYIRACNAAIESLNLAINRIDDSIPNLKNAKDNFENGYKGGAITLALDEFNNLNTDATSQRNSVSASIASLQSIIVEFEQKIQQLEAQKAAELQRLIEAAKELVRKAGEAIQDAAETAFEAVTKVLS